MSVRTGRSRPGAVGVGAAVAVVGTLGAMYMVTQVMRNSIGVLAPDLAAELGLSAAQVGLLASAFFMAFAAAQIPLGVALDRFGPKRCMLFCAAIVLVGVVWFSTATTPTGLILARALLGLGSSCYLMGPLALYAHRFPPERFATLAGIQLGIGTTGTLIATAPLAMSAAAVGWRTTFLFVGGGVLLVGALLALVVPSDRTARKAANQERLGESIAGVLKAMRTPDIGRLFLMHLATYSSFVLILGLWGGPYLTHIYGYSLTERGDLLFLAAAGQVAGQFLWGPTERLLRSHKVPVLAGSWLTVVALAVPAVLGKLPVGGLMAWLVVFGVITAYTPVLIAHGKTLFPPELVGRGMTLLNIGTMGGAFVSQAVTGIIINQFPADGGAYPLLAYQLIFGLQAAALLLATLAYLRARDDRSVAA